MDIGFIQGKARLKRFLNQSASGWLENTVTQPNQTVRVSLQGYNTITPACVGLPVEGNYHKLSIVTLLFICH